MESINPARYDTDQTREVEAVKLLPKWEVDCFHSSGLATMAVDSQRAEHRDWVEMLMVAGHKGWVEALMADQLLASLNQGLNKIHSCFCPQQYGLNCC